MPSVGLVRLDRPEALDRETVRARAEALRAFDDDPAIGALVIAGSGRAFAGGPDPGEMAEASSVQMLFSDLISGWDEIARAEVEGEVRPA